MNDYDFLYSMVIHLIAEIRDFANTIALLLPRNLVVTHVI